ncbi:hypothetical protein GGR51DRAFT_503310 [Nemania sp. FL0031]|nr:hypothetical protein GGR51DRAFT_503310 [Nemania sp. FL0031]
MYYSVLFSALLLGATATPVEQRQGPPGEVSNFAAHTDPYSDNASFGYDFELTGRVATHCNFSVATSDPAVPSVPITPCDNTTVRWEFFPVPLLGAPYRLVIIYQPAIGAAAETYSQALPRADFPAVSFGSKDGFVYIGEPKFEAYRVD